MVQTCAQRGGARQRVGGTREWGEAAWEPTFEHTREHRRAATHHEGEEQVEDAAPGLVAALIKVKGAVAPRDLQGGQGQAMQGSKQTWPGGGRAMGARQHTPLGRHEAADRTCAAASKRQTQRPPASQVLKQAGIRAAAQALSSRRQGLHTDRLTQAVTKKPAAAGSTSGLMTA